ncbi:3-oxoacyl-ACP synthase [Candidatus Desulfofervidus auxilii]|uniref:3-oxoacyl-[acyl-carrier-protein] synthase 2 n=1 Tax=Desulfofervidus auxilii TaxID=1621989 RepID=A0A7U4TIB6_DESA2|nr:beta-ketoacyl-ACP synthase II [Candidatus Desulfofervidus auxilii]AMM41814.1 3-oxoacyl-ACP synthase [Candidatus Desulfofervidus auxilii]
MRKRRVVITGLGVIAPNGIGKDAFWKALKEGKSGITKITRFDVSSYSSQIAGEINDFDPTDFMSPKSARRMDRFAQLAVAASKMALEDSGLIINGRNNKKIGIIMGTALAGMPYAEFQHSIFMEKGLNRIDPLLATRLFGGEASSQTSIELGIKGPCATLSTTCAAGTDAIGYALMLIRNSIADVVIAGGAEAPLAPMTFGAFCRLGVMSQMNNNPQKASRPFDKNRDGFVMSEGAGAVILEELEHALKRNAHIYAELVGYGATSDAFHMTRASDDAEGIVRAIRMALKDARVDTEKIDYINAHGTSTTLGDKIETLAFKKIFGPYAYKIPISSTKSMIGHPLGGGGAIEAVASVLTIEHEFIHPTINYEIPDPDCDLNYVPNKGIKAKVKFVLSNSLGFGSRNAAIIIKKYSGA